MWMYNGVIRDMLIKMLDWYIRIENNFSVSAGKHGKYLKKYLPELVYKSFVKTYSGSDYDDFWAAIFTGCDLFRSTAKFVAKILGFTYDLGEDKNKTAYLINKKTTSS